MSTPRSRRLAKERQAANLIESQHGELETLLTSVMEDIGGDLFGLNAFQRDSRLAVEMAHRLDKAVHLENPLMEAADFFVFYLSSLGAIGIYRAVERATKRKKTRLGTLKKRLENSGPKMAAAAKRRIERRITRLEKVL